ncbi:MAG: DUF386 domain-containing protein [Ruminococcaceae bacterium]|nr:DUF386 domain-containing protein [Oscillospiraceae bacterium]MBQ9913647.1 YhcH/YjgK/YiaL family protein [Clostridia bacterium]
MIIDNLKNSHQYRKTHDGFAESFDFLKKAVEENLPAGRYEIDSDRVFAFIQEYTSKTDSAFEAHKNYIDIQFISEGTEVIYAADVASLKVKEDYSAERDIMFLEDCERASKAVLQKGEYGIFFPWDAHKPGLCCDGKPDNVKKIVVKVRAI